MLDDLAFLPTGKPATVKPKKEKDKRLYIVVPFRALHDEKLTHRQLLALMVVCSYADKQGNLWPGTKKLADDMGITQPGMTQHLNKLTEKGYLKVIEHGYKPGEQAKKRAIIYDPENPVTDEAWIHQHKERIKEQQEPDNKQTLIQPELNSKQSEQAVFKVWKAAVNKSFPGTPVTYEEKHLKLIASQYTLEKVKKMTPVALQACRVPPSSVRLLIRYLKK